MQNTESYTNTAFIPDGDSYEPRWIRRAADFRARMPPEVMLYGDGLREKVDLFWPEGTPGGLVVFIHGGYWLQGDRSLWSHLAAGPLAAGWAVAVAEYDLCPAVTIPQITAQVARAVAVAAGAVPGPVRIAGHSAGGHLAARMGCADVALAVRHRVERIVPISPLADLAPLILTEMNARLGIDADLAQRHSPMHHAAPACPVTVWVGERERPVFLDQAHWLAGAWGCDLHVEAGANHFSVIEGLERVDSPLMRALLAD